MSFEPEPGTSVKLNNESIEFISLESTGPAAVFVYAESGKEGIVYKVMKSGEFYALKVFYPDYRDKRLLENTEKLSRFKNLEGFRVAERTVINHELFPEVVNMYPELNYSVLMPWIEGTGWGNLMIANDRQLQLENYIQIARSLIRVVCNLEAQGLAHCDLSNNNFIIDQTLSSIQLIDIEDMYAPDMPRPIPDISYGTIGYRTKWIAENGLWGPESDRFACAILCSEIITWHNSEIRENRAGDTSFFDEEEIGENSERYKLMTRNLKDLYCDLEPLFTRAWFSEGTEQCPPVADWKNAIEKIGKSIPSDEEMYFSQDETQQENPTIIHVMSNGMITGVPPKMEISHEILDFGVLHHPNVTFQFSISNTGGSVLTGDINSESWVATSPDHFSIEPGENQTFKVSLNDLYPRPKSGFEYRTPNALSVESNAGGEIIGASYILEKPPFYESWWKRALAGGTLGIIIGFFLLLITSGSSIPFPPAVIVIMGILCGLAGLISYPHKLSVIFLVLGFISVGSISFALTDGDISSIEDFAILIALGASLGLPIGAVVSRILLGILRRTHANK